MFPLKSRTKLTIRNAYKIIVTVWISAAIASVPHLLSVVSEFPPFLLLELRNCYILLSDIMICLMKRLPMLIIGTEVKVT